MQELINNIVARFGLDPAVAQQAVAAILGMLKQYGPADKVQQMMNAIPGASELVAGAAGDDHAAPAAAGGMLGGLGGMVSGMLGGQGGAALMETLGKLQGLGLDLEQAKGVGLETLNFAREKAGDETVGAVVDQVPGLKDLL